jgi:hypothetical protein
MSKIKQDNRGAKARERHWQRNHAVVFVDAHSRNQQLLSQALSQFLWQELTAGNLENGNVHDNRQWKKLTIVMTVRARINSFWSLMVIVSA